MLNKNNFQLSEEQLKIVQSDIYQNQKIGACAGSGKTTTLIYRVKYLIDNNIEPQKIILTTFNVEAAQNLKKKAEQVLQPNDLKDLKIINIDKFIYEIYQNYLKMKDPLQVKCIKQSLKYISGLVLKYLTSDQGKHVVNQYSHFFFDEFQDINDIQYNILMEFCKNNCKIIAIGDEAQNIYSFRNSKLEFIQKKIDVDVDNYQNQKINIYQLSINFRSQSKIVEFCNQILVSMKQSNQMKSAKQSLQEEEKPIVKIYQSEQEQYEKIIKEIYDLVKKDKYQLSDIAILSPRNEEIKHIQAILQRKNYEVRNKNKYQQNETIIEQEQQQEEIPYKILKKNSNLLLLNILDDDNSPKLTLSTFHCSKGLEWKVVYIVGINDKQFPESFLTKSNQQYTEEQLIEIQRTFYVACTRSINFLNLSFVNNQGSNQFICRFMSQISEEYFQKEKNFHKKNIAKINLDKKQFIKKDEKQFQQNLKKNNHKESSLCQIISNFQFCDFEKINYYLQDLEKPKINTKLDKQKVAYVLKDLKPNNNCQNLISYLDLLLQRTIAEKFDINSGYRFERAEKILYSIYLDKKQYEIFNTFEKQFKDYCEITSNKKQFLEKLQTQYQTEQAKIQNINSSKQELECIYDKIKSFLKEKNIKFKDIQIQDEAKKYFPDNFQDKQQFYEFYQQFRDKQHIFLEYLKMRKSEQQTRKTQFIYELSKLDLIYQQKQECLYRSDTNDIQIYHKYSLVFNIQRFLKIIEAKKRNNKDFTIEIKKKVKDEDLYGVVDLLVDDTIYKFVYNFSEVCPIQIAHEDIIQQLAYALILNKQGAKITQISFYNIIEEDKIDYSIQNFIENPVKSKDYLEFLKEKANILKQQPVQQQIIQEQMPNLNLANEINNYQLQSNQNESQLILQFQDKFETEDSLKNKQQDQKNQMKLKKNQQINKDVSPNNDFFDQNQQQQKNLKNMPQNNLENKQLNQKENTIRSSQQQKYNPNITMVTKRHKQFELQFIK
ncbi:UvrD/REP helicase family protein (macronuclear) [Tetrahymena thermophila SB210]|uniref:DNA 3'-5' helicase n=1 Tax=Tetrahymena thermophila (strain SB210) TaxID=312017 RepID=Q245I4_TETTS|nr:UvrD/REP helicase family protein [Tetrahymena thermophila SB210]EAS03380.2 UvrD/REP helicase family protein [Tetrahymena thermophila SB210]|eukprot:XP_001023625.2 UvrD/REP helicase family protein [Tetrahymena thermophila SB210]